jgi:hypothetical protein
MRRLPRLALVAVVALGAAWFSRHSTLFGEPAAPAAPGAPQASGTPATVERQPDLSREASGTQLRVGGQVQRLLADDRDGSPHQRFIIATDSGITLLIAHNIALAPRLEGIAVGDRVEVYGEYEWNDKGGVVHWTHKDPRGDHVAGYIEWRGQRYQ